MVLVGTGSRGVQIEGGYTVASVQEMWDAVVACGHGWGRGRCWGVQGWAGMVSRCQGLLR